MKTYDFKSFCRGELVEQPRPAFKAYSFIPIPTFSDIFFSEPVLIVAGAGVLLIGVALLERHLVKNGKEVEAEAIQALTGIVFPSIAIAGAVWVLYYAGRIFL